MRLWTHLVHPVPSVLLVLLLQISTSAFLGTSMAKVEMGESRVSMMGFSRQELERKPLSLIKTLARRARDQADQQG